MYALLSSGKPVGRERLAALLWGDRGDEQARASVRQALYELRHISSTHAPLLSVTREHVVADPRFIAIDIEEIEARARAGDISAVCEALPRQQLTLFSDLDGITPEFDDWLHTERTHRLDRIIASAVAAGVAAVERKDAEPVRTLATVLEMIDPLCEPAVRLGIRADVLRGDPTSAVRRYKRLEERLQRDLETEPSAETQSLLQLLDAPDRADMERVNGHSTVPAIADVPRDLPSGHATATHRSKRWLWPAAAALLVFLVLGAVAVSLFASKPDQPPAVAILPFKELPPRGEAADYFASGVSEEILNLLARDSKLRVLGSTSTRLFAARSDTRDVARTLGVSHLLEGSVRSQGNRVRVSVRLIRADQGTQLWVQEYERALDDIFAVQQEIATSVAQRLSGTLVPSRSSLHISTHADVYDRYLQARSLIQDRRESTITHARTLLFEAVALDPEYAPAWANLSIATMLLADHPTTYGTIPLEQARQQASHYASRALALAPDLGAAHAAVGLVSLSNAASIPHYERAIALEPQHSEYHRWLGQAQTRIGKNREALQEFRRSAELEPLWALAAQQVIDQLAEMGRHDEIDKVVRDFTAVSRVAEDIETVRITAFRAQGQLPEMIKAARRLPQEGPHRRDILVKVASVLAALGETQAALAMMPRDKVLRRAVISRDIPLIESLARKNPYGFWNEELGVAGAGELLVASGRDRLLLELFDARYSSVDQFWAQEETAVDQSPALIVALRAAGRTGEATRLNTRSLQYIDAAVRSGIAPEAWAIERAQHLALSGADADALTELERIMQARWVEFLRVPFHPLAAWPALQSLATHPRLLALQRDLQERIAQTRTSTVQG